MAVQKTPATNSRRVPGQKQHKELETKVNSFMGPKIEKFGWSHGVKNPGNPLCWQVFRTRIDVAHNESLVQN